MHVHDLTKTQRRVQCLGSETLKRDDPLFATQVWLHRLEIETGVAMSHHVFSEFVIQPVFETTKSLPPWLCNSSGKGPDIDYRGGVLQWPGFSTCAPELGPLFNFFWGLDKPPNWRFCALFVFEKIGQKRTRKKTYAKFFF